MKSTVVKGCLGTMGSQAQMSEAEYFPISLHAQRHPTCWSFLQSVGNQRLKTSRILQNQVPRNSSCHFPAQYLSVHHHSHMAKEDKRVWEGDKPGDQSSGKSSNVPFALSGQPCPPQLLPTDPEAPMKFQDSRALNSREPVCSHMERG